jgi:hypothetical protein
MADKHSSLFCRQRRKSFMILTPDPPGTEKKYNKTFIILDKVDKAKVHEWGWGII